MLSLASGVAHPPGAQRWLSAALQAACPLREEQPSPSHPPHCLHYCCPWCQTGYDAGPAQHKWRHASKCQSSIVCSNKAVNILISSALALWHQPQGPCLAMGRRPPCLEQRVCLPPDVLHCISRLPPVSSWPLHTNHVCTSPRAPTWGPSRVGPGPLCTRHPSPNTAAARISGDATVRSCTRRSAAPSRIAVREICSGAASTSTVGHQVVWKTQSAEGTPTASCQDIEGKACVAWVREARTTTTWQVHALQRSDMQSR
jgi:hypothetical protein